MSYSNKYHIPCPKCKTASEQLIFQSLNETTANAAIKIINDEINFITCPNCNNKFQVKTGLLYCNHIKGIAIYYNPTDVNAIDDEFDDIKRMFGNKSYLAHPDKFDDWQAFKDKVAAAEGISKPKLVFPSFPKTSRTSYVPSRSWSCSICDGDETTGCLYFDPTECPKFS
jgi:hypothetical protein